MLSETKIQLQKLEERVDKIGNYLTSPSKVKNLENLKKLTEKANFWDDQQNARKILQEISRIEGEIKSWENLKESVEESLTLANLAFEEGDESVEKEIAAALDNLSHTTNLLELKVLLSEKYDKDQAILSINAGAGGTDAQDWAQILMRMYLRWAETKGYSVEVPDISYGEEAGIKSATMFINGIYAYGYLKSERGIHRLVRISPFDAAHRRHTSFASVEIIPETSGDFKVSINPQDLRIETFRASGPGGQHLQKTESAVRITHIPTGIVAQSQSDRSQHRNKEMALKILMSRLFERLQNEHKERLEELVGEQKEIAWGNQIRSYIFHPYTLVKDHRTGAETGSVASVIDGNLDIFIEAYLKSARG